MARRFESHYRVNGDDLTDEFFNRRLNDVDLRIAALEEQLGQFDQAVDTLIQRGLDQINTQLQASIAALQVDIDAANATLVAVNAAVDALEQTINDIVSGGSLPATGITVSGIPGIAATNVSAALAEHQADIESLQAQINGVGEIFVVADYTAAAALTGLFRDDVIHVEDNGSGKWVRYQVTATGDGTWAGVTKIVLGTQDQQPATHSHAIADVTGLQTALDDKLAAADYTAADVLAKLMTVDGDASGLDADKWKGASFTVSTSTPSGGADGDFWFEREA
ncbi:MAG: hypothetical protein ACK4TP_11205 [Hyphomicrobium sp.]